MSLRKTVRGALRDSLIRRDGPNTAELRRVNAGRGLGQLPASRVPTSTVASVCGYCATGCSLDVHVRDGAPVSITPRRSAPVNRGSACPKGWEALAPVRSSERLQTPLLRDENGVLVPVSWERAAHEFVTRFRAVQERHGAASTAWLSTGQIPTEEMALLGAFAKFEMGMLHGDGNTRQCMATAATAHKESFGFDAPPFTYADFEESDVIVLVGSNLCIAHPILWERVLRNPHRPDIVVIDPRRTETAAAASLHLAIQPSSDLALFSGLARRLIELDAVDHDFIREHTTGLESMRDAVGPWTLDATAVATGLTPADIDGLAHMIAGGQRVSFWWTMGINQGHQAVRSAQAIINVALLTGNIGRPGTGANSITGQCNAMGSRLFANTTNLFGGRSFTDTSHRAEVAEILGVDEARIPRVASLAYDQILEGIDDGDIRGLWIVATNTAHSWPDRHKTAARLDRLEFLVVQDLFADTDTVRHAHLVLPAGGWGEKTGTFINAERRIGVTAKVCEPPGHARSDFDIVTLLARTWGSGPWLDRWSSPEAVFADLRELSRGRPCDFTGIRGYDQLTDAGGIQWPAPVDPSGTLPDAFAAERRLFADGRFFHADGRARFVAEAVVAPPEVPTPSRPLVLLTGRRSSAEWHTGTRTGRSAVLRSLAGATSTLALHPRDAEDRGISDGDAIVATSDRGAMHAIAKLTNTVQRGHAFAAMHDLETNNLTAIVVDPYSRQPAFKQSCVEVRRRVDADTRKSPVPFS